MDVAGGESRGFGFGLWGLAVGPQGVVARDSMVIAAGLGMLR